MGRLVPACPMQAVLPSGTIDCRLPRGHGGSHHYTPPREQVLPSDHGAFQMPECERRADIAVSALGDAQLLCHLNGLHTGPHFDAADEIWWETAAESGASPHIDLTGGQPRA